MANSAFTNLTIARDNLFTAAEKTIEASAKLEDEKSSATIAGKFDGKNAETREAQARDFLAQYYIALSTCQKLERAARYEFDKAQIEVDTVKTLLRIAELA